MHTSLASLTALLATLALAIPAPDSSAASIYTGGQFTIAFSVGSGGNRTFFGVGLEADQSSPSKDLLLVGRGAPRSSLATPASAKNTGSSTAALIFAVREGPLSEIYTHYGAIASNYGDTYGKVGPVYAVQGESQSQWYVNQTTVNHLLFHPTQALFACDTTLNGGTAKILSFGVRNKDGSAPRNCDFTEVAVYIMVAQR